MSERPPTTNSFAPGMPLQLAGKRLALTAHGLKVELVGSLKLAGGLRSFLRLLADSFGYRAQRLRRVNSGGRRRTVSLKDGTRLTYRSNRGDVRAIAETWMAKAYELPFDLRPRNVLDLGAHIGATAVWLVRRYGGLRLIAVEPVPENAELARLNLERNAIHAEVVNAAIASQEGTGCFELSTNSTLGRISDSGIDVPLVTPRSLIDRFPIGERIDLLKMDVEGAEEQILNSDLDWLARVDCLIVELHADRTDCERIVANLEGLGFSYTEIGKQNKYKGVTDVMAVFRRGPAVSDSSTREPDGQAIEREVTHTRTP